MWELDRRRFLAGAAASLAVTAPRAAAAAASEVVAATYVTWVDGYRAVVAPAVKRAGHDLVLTEILAFDQVAKASAARGKPPFDVMLLDTGTVLIARERGLIEPIDTKRLSNWSKLAPRFQHEWGPTASINIVGIGYNPKKVDRPKGWADLFKPEFARHFAPIGFGTAFGTAAMVEIAKAHGGSEADMEPAFKAIRSMLPQFAGIAANTSQLASLYRLGQADIIVGLDTNLKALRDQGVEIEFVRPESGAPIFETSLNIAKGSTALDAAYAYIDQALSAEVQDQLQKPPYNLTPTNRTVELTASVKQSIGSFDELDKLIVQDWAKINANRPAWIETFNRVVKA